MVVSKQAAKWRGWRRHDIFLYLYNTTACQRRALASIVSPAAKNDERMHNNNNNQNDHNNNDGDKSVERGLKF